VSSQPTASIVIPTSGRPDYLHVTLASVAPQAQAHEAEVLVVNDGADRATAAVAAGYGARVVDLAVPGGANAARNAGIRASRSELIVLLDDDVEVPAGWLTAMLEGVAGRPERDVFGGPIRGRLEGGGPRSCGREPAPITTLDHGQTDRDVDLVWSANMAIRRHALDRVGEFDETLQGRGEEEDWERRYRALGGTIRYLAKAGLDHRRTAADSTLTSLARSAYGHGRASRRYDLRKGDPPSVAGELRTLVGSCWHVIRRRCANGIVMAAQAAGRLRETLAGGSR
jgi:GT2 family glycosyltransferase